MPIHGEWHRVIYTRSDRPFTREEKKLKKMSKRARGVIAGLATFGLVAGVALTMSTTGAYFSDTEAGTVSGSVGSIKVAVDHHDLTFTNLLPGSVQTVSAHATNNGLNNQDVYVVFNNADALHALNDLGGYGEFHVSANGVEQFASTNLNDGTVKTDCGAFSPAGCWPVPKAIRLATNVAPGASVLYSFGFGYSGLLKGQTTDGGGVWNSYPLGAPTASGLPYEIVAVQPGQQP